MKQITLIILSLILFGSLKSQMNFENSYSTGGYDYARAITQTSDSGYVTVGSTEGNFGLSDLYLLKIFPNGDIQWGKRYGGTNVDFGQDIIETYDSNLMIVGYTNSNINSDYDIYLVKTNALGDSIFTKTISWNDWDFAYSLQETADSGYIIAGETYQNGNSDALLIKTNSNGDTLWTKTYGGANDDKFEKVIIAANGDFIMAGTTESFGNQKQAYVLKTDNSGNIIWEKNFGNAQDDFAKSIIEISTNELLFAGATNTPPETDYDNWIVKIDANGSFVGNSKVTDFGGSPTVQNDDYYETIIEIRDSIVAGGNRSYKYSDPGNVYLEIQNKIINSGRTFLKFVSEDFESIHDIKKCKDGGIILACSSEGLSSGGSSIYLIKIDSNLSFPSDAANSISTKFDVSSVEDQTTKNEIIKIICYPNPASNNISFNIQNDNKNYKIIITDITGKTIDVITNSLAKINYNISKLKNGIYLANFYLNDTFVNQTKIIIYK
jgi:hypothetical protein